MSLLPDRAMGELNPLHCPGHALNGLPRSLGVARYLEIWGSETLIGLDQDRARGGRAGAGGKPGISFPLDVLNGTRDIFRAVCRSRLAHGIL